MLPDNFLDNATLATSLISASILDNGSSCLTYPLIEAFKIRYSKIHVYVIFILCPLGVLSNLLNVIVLNQRSMHCPTNLLLTALAIMDGLTMAFYMPFAAWLHIHEGFTSYYAWATFILLYVSFSNFIHVASSGVIIVLAVFRVLYVRYLLAAKQLCSQQRACLAIWLVLAASGVLNISCVVVHRIENTQRGYRINYVENGSLERWMHWNTAIFCKLLPVICLFVLSFVLIFSIQRQNRRAKMMKEPQHQLLYSPSNLSSPNNLSHAITLPEQMREIHNGSIATKNSVTSGLRVSVCNEIATKTHPYESISESFIQMDRRFPPVHYTPQTKVRESSREADGARTTRLLLVILIIFVVSYMPQAVLLLCNSILDKCFSETVYNPLGDFLDLLTLTNNGINFILYCAMSRKFRNTFLAIFCSFHKYFKPADRLDKNAPISIKSKSAFNVAQRYNIHDGPDEEKNCERCDQESSTNQILLADKLDVSCVDLNLSK